MRFFLIFIALLFLFYFFKHKHESIPSNASLTAQQHSLLSFEKKLECEAHTPCFNASVNGAGQRDPYTALKICTENNQQMDAILIPEDLPPRVKTELEQAKGFLKKDIEDSIASAQDHIDVEENRPRTHQIAYEGAQTCRAYPIIQRINKEYGIDKMMRGQYINCEVLSSL